LDVGKEVFAGFGSINNYSLEMRNRTHAEHLARSQHGGRANQSELEEKIAAGKRHETKIG
jgi:hypothetical protein